MKKWLFIGLVALVSVTIGLIKSNRKLQKECERQSGNIAILMKDIKSYKIRDSLNAVSVSALNLVSRHQHHHHLPGHNTAPQQAVTQKAGALILIKRLVMAGARCRKIGRAHV